MSTKIGGRAARLAERRHILNHAGADFDTKNAKYTFRSKPVKGSSA
jgi:hypothetical protein